MKKLLLSTLAIASIFALKAQHVITRANAPKADIAANFIIDTIPSVSKGASGANATWDLTNFDFDVIAEPFMYSDASTMPGASEFPDAELGVVGGFNGIGDLFYNLDDNQLEWLGIYGDFGSGPQTIRLANTQIDQKYPSTFQNAYKDTAQVRFSFFFGQNLGVQVDSVRITYFNFKDVSYDGFGTVTTPFGSYTESLRERAYTINEQKVEFCVAFIPGFPCTYVDANTVFPGISQPRDTSVIYSWYTNASASPVAILTYDFDDATILSAEMQDLSSGLNDLSKAADQLVYPNPANDIITVKGDAQSISILDLTGRVVLSKALSGNKQIDISNLAPGSYIANVYTSNGVTSNKLSVVK